MKQFLTLVIAFLALATGTTRAEETTTLPQLRITFSGSVKRDMAYVNGTMKLTDTDGSTVELNAKFKTRGATAQSYLQKPSLNMKLQNDDYTADVDSMLLGIRSCSKYILDAMAIDRICMRNRVCMDIWNAYSRLPYDTDFDGRNGTKGKFVEVYINNTYKGIYCLSDAINRKLLNLKKYDETKNLVRGVLYKNGTDDLADQSSEKYSDDSLVYVVAYHNAWELKYPDDHAGAAAWAPLADLFKNKTKYAEAQKYFYMDNLVDYQLLVMALCIEDNWGNKNHFFSIRNIQKNIDDADATEAARRKVVLTPWDLDTSIGGHYNGNYYNGTYNDWEVSNVFKNGFYPYSLYLGQATYKNALKQRWAELRKTAFAPASVNARLEAYANLFVNSGAWKRQASVQPKYVSDLLVEVSLIETWYKERFAQMDTYFGVTSGMQGDVNGDGKITMDDAYCVADYYAGKTVSNIDLTVADMNGDGKITMADANAIANSVLGK